MKRKLPFSVPAVLTALVLPGAALVGCKSTEMADTGAESTTIASDSGIAIVRPASVEPLDQKEASAATTIAASIADQSADKDGADASAEKEKEKAPGKFRIFGKKDRSKAEAEPDAETDAAPSKLDATDVAEAQADQGTGEEERPAAEPKRGRKPLFGRKSKAGETPTEAVAESGGGTEPEVAAVKEKKKFRLFGFGRKKDKDADEAEDESSVAAKADTDGADAKKGVPAGGGPKPLPWEEPAPELAGAAIGEIPDPDAPARFPDAVVDPSGSAAGVTARIRPGDPSGGIGALDPTPDPGTSPLDSVPSLTADPPVTNPRDDGFLPLTPEPKFPGEEGILPPGN